MAPLDSITYGEAAKAHRPWPRVIVTDDGWRQAIELLASGHCSLLGLWGDAPKVHMALLDEASGDIAVVSYACKIRKVSERRRAPSAGDPARTRNPRSVRSRSSGSPDPRPWLDLGFWDVRHPLGKQAPARKPAPYDFLPAEGEGLHQIPVGPVHAGIIEPGHFRFTANGEHVVRLEQRLGWVHKGIESLMDGATLEEAAKLASRTSGDSTVAYAYAFAQAAEAALQIKAPPRGVYLRALMAELERLANHFGDIGAICNDASFSLMHAQCGILRERCLRAAEACFGHRLMMDVIVPGGVARDIAPEGFVRIGSPCSLKCVAYSRGLIELYDNTASLQDRTVTTGIVKPELARQFGAGGYVGRASGRAFDARRAFAYAPYDRLSFEVPVLDAGDVNARVWIRIREVEQSLSLIEQILGALPEGALKAATGKGKGLRRPRHSRGFPRRRAGVAAARRQGARGALPSARCLMVPVAAAGSCDRGQHRRRLPALQQIVQLLVFGT